MLFNYKNSIISKLYLIKSFLFFLFIAFITYNSKTEKNNKINIDNELPLYENNINFSKYSTDIKAIALYLPQFHSIKENDEWWGKGFTEWTNVRKATPLFPGHYQPRLPLDEYLGYYYLTSPEVIKKQVELAKSHGIYGFGIYYYWFSGKRLLEKPLDIFLNNKEIEFHFLLIWANENWTRRWDGFNKDILMKQEYKTNDPSNFIIDIKKYLLDERYIKINGKYVLGLYEPFKIPNLRDFISIWREKSKEYGIGELYIIVTLNTNKIENIEKQKLFDAAYQFSPRDSFNYLIKSTHNLYLYTAILYKNFDIKKNFDFYKGSMLKFDNTPRRNKSSAIFQNYSPEQFYMLNKNIINWTRTQYNITKQFIFINAWNEWGEGTYLEPDKKYGYASINAFSKALFNLPYIQINRNLISFKKITKIAIQVHIFYKSLINEIINKINNIPFKFDLYISTNSMENKQIIETSLKNNSNVYNYEIVIFENKGRDVVPFLSQMKRKIKRYKYICHIHTKKTYYMNFSDDWRNYLFNNLLGNKKIISEIITDFENNSKLGFIFPENYYKILLNFNIYLTDNDKYYMNYLLDKIFKNRTVGEILDFPMGNMFWARVKAIYQIFKTNIDYSSLKEQGQIDGTIIHAIERIWLYLVKINGYYYKKIFKHL